MAMRILCLPILVLMSSCFDMPIISSGKVSVLNSQPRLAATTELTEGKSLSSFNPNSRVATTISAPSGALSGSSITLSPGSLSIAVDLVVEQAVGLSQTSLTSSLGIDSAVAITPVGAGLIIRPSADVDLKQPLTIAMPIDPVLGLKAWLSNPMRIFSQKYYAVFFKYFVDGELRAGVIPGNALRISENGQAIFEGYFGAYWLVEVSIPIEEKKEIKTDEPIVNKDNVSVIESTGIVTEEKVVAKTAIPPVQWNEVIVFFDSSKRQLRIKGSIAEGRALNSCRVDLFEDTAASTGINETTDAQLFHIHSISKEQSHSLVARFRCIDDQGRQSSSPWSSVVLVPAKTIAIEIPPNLPNVPLPVPPAPTLLPLLPPVADRVFPLNYLKENSSLILSFDNIRPSPPDDKDMQYSCSFKILSTIDSAPSTCDSLPGTFQLGSQTGDFSWLPGSKGAGAYEFTISASNSVGTAARSFRVAVLPDIDTNSRLLHIDARFADGARGARNGVTSSPNWLDLSNNASSANLLNFNSSAWSGTLQTDPMALNFDGINDYLLFPQLNFAARSTLHFDTWVFQGDNQNEKVILSNSDNGSRGFVLSDRSLWLGSRANQSYPSAVLQDSPKIYWRFDSINDGFISDASGYAHAGIIVNPENVYPEPSEGNSGALGAFIRTAGIGYIKPAQNFPLGSAWTIETWFRYPFPDGCQTGWCTLARGPNHHHVLVKEEGMQLGTYIGGFFGSGYGLSLLSPGWHHLAAVGGGGTTRFYIDGLQAGGVVNTQTTEHLEFVGGIGTQPFGQIDEFAVYDKALSPSQILAHSNSDAGPLCSYSMANGDWHHLAGTLDDTASSGKLFVNGAKVCEFSLPEGKTLMGSSEPLTVGRSVSGESSSWAGKISSLVFYSDASVENIGTNYGASMDTYGPTFSMPMGGLQLWLRADKGLFQDFERTIPALASNDPIAYWVDQSGTGGDMKVKSGLDLQAARPKLKMNSLNGKPVLSFDGNDNLQNFVSYGSPNTIFIVARYSGQIRERILSGSSGNWLLGWWGGNFDVWHAETWLSSSYLSADNSWQIYSADQSSSGQRMFKSGQQIFNNTTAVGYPPNGLTLGSWRGSSEWSTCEVAELIVYNRVLDEQERAAVFTYLQNRYLGGPSFD